MPVNNYAILFNKPLSTKFYERVKCNKHKMFLFTAN